MTTTSNCAGNSPLPRNCRQTRKNKKHQTTQTKPSTTHKIRQLRASSRRCAERFPVCAVRRISTVNGATRRGPPHPPRARLPRFTIVCIMCYCPKPLLRGASTFFGGTGPVRGAGTSDVALGSGRRKTNTCSPTLRQHCLMVVLHWGRQPCAAGRHPAAPEILHVAWACQIFCDRICLVCC